MFTSEALVAIVDAYQRPTLIKYQNIILGVVVVMPIIHFTMNP